MLGQIQSRLDSSKLWGLLLQARMIQNVNIFAFRVIRTCKNSANIHYMKKKINQ